MAVFPLEFWIGFLIFLVLALAIDLGLLHKTSKKLSFKEASIMTGVWVTSALFFCLLIYLYSGAQQSNEFLTGYIIELSLSMDNIFVFIMVFTYFKVPTQYQHRILFWGILGAIIMRFVMIIGGIYLIHYFEWLFLFLGAFLIYTGYHIAVADHDKQEVKDDKKTIIHFLQRFFRISNKFEGNKFFVRNKGKLVATPLFIVLIIVEKTDLIFALDSIPAVLAITRDPFIVFTSNIFAILGLRSMYFLLATIMNKFRFLKYGISLILVFVGIKMILSVIGFKIDTMASLLLITATLGTSIFTSIMIPPSKNRS